MTLTRYSVELRARLDGNTLYGHAAVFGVQAKVPGGYEQLDRHAFDQVLDSTDTDVRALINHDPNLVLGRQSSGTLRLKVDDQGLGFEVDLPDVSYARDLRELVSRGDVTGASFAFIPGQDQWDGQLRTHTSVAELVDTSVVTFPAYESTAVALRNYNFDRSPGRSVLIRARHRVTEHYARKGG